MEELANRIQGVIDQLQGLRITSNYDTMNKLMWSMQTLAKIRDELKEEKHGDDHAE